VARPVAWRAVAASPADVLLAVLDALPGDADLAVVRREPGEWLVGVAPDARVEASGAEALDRLDRLDGGWWAGWLTYDLGRAVERVERRRPDDLGLPDVSLARFDARLVVGPSGLRLEGDGPTRARGRSLRASWSPVSIPRSPPSARSARRRACTWRSSDWRPSR